MTQWENTQGPWVQSLAPKGGGGVAELKPFGGDWRAGRKRKLAHSVGG